MYYYLVNYQLQAEHSRIVIPMSYNPDESTLKAFIAEIKRRPDIVELIEIKDFKQVTEDIYTLISPFINGSYPELTSE